MERGNGPTVLVDILPGVWTRSWFEIARGADWIATEYNNENSPSTFYTLGAATPVSLGNNTQFTQSPAFGESFTMPSGGAVSVRSYASVPSGTLSAIPASPQP